jgi:hypothetical protein
MLLLHGSSATCGKKEPGSLEIEDSVMNRDFFKEAKRLARKLDTPQMRELYRRDKANNSSLDKNVDKLTKEIKDGLKHDGTPK